MSTARRGLSRHTRTTLQRTAIGLGIGLLAATACAAASSCAPAPQNPPTPPSPLASAAPVPAAPSAAADASAATAPPEPAMPPAAALLKNGYEKRYPERLLALANRTNGDARVVVARESGRTRYIFDDSGVRVLLWIADSELWETVSEVTAVALTAGPPPEEAQVKIGPGVFIERMGDKDGFAKVRAFDRSFAVEGFVPASLITRVYVPKRVPEILGDGDSWGITKPTKLLSRPGGPPLAELVDQAPTRVHLEELAPARGQYVEVGYRSPNLSVRGFAAKRSLVHPGRYEHPGSWGAPGLPRNPPDEYRDFPKGACLYAEPWGEVIGVLFNPVRARVHIESTERAAWRELPLAWPPAKVWIPLEGSNVWVPGPDAKPIDDSQPLDLSEGFRCAPPPTRAAAAPGK